MDPPIEATPPTPTFRLSELPLSIGEDQLEAYLNSLPFESQNDDDDGSENVLSFSLAPYKTWQVATVTFHQEPQLFAKCQPNHSIRLRLPHEFARARYVVDCDFMGITPLYRPKNPEIE